jgi:cyclophilin family peptidyl-prolyl cis-trans isomerase
MYFKKKQLKAVIMLTLLFSTILLGCDVTKNTESYGQKGATGKVDLLNPGDTLSSKGYGKTDTRGVQVKKAQSYDAPPPMFIDTDKELYFAKIVLEKGGTMTLELYSNKAPITVNNFVFLANNGFYDGVTFHRVIPNFMAQTGDPTGTGMGSPGYKFDNELHPDLSHDSKGIVSMANGGIQNGKGTNGSQFFITFVPTEQLDGFNPDGSDKDCRFDSCHAVFGKVIEGLDVLDSISERDPGSATTSGDVIKTITIQKHNN